MRGKEQMNAEIVTSIRITPAYAGKSRKASSRDSVMRDHPRLCGEKFSRILAVVELLGSPPPMRGKGRTRKSRIFCRGITPAYAGKRVSGFSLNL